MDYCIIHIIFTAGSPLFGLRERFNPNSQEMNVWCENSGQTLIANPLSSLPFISRAGDERLFGRSLSVHPIGLVPQLPILFNTSFISSVWRGSSACHTMSPVVPVAMMLPSMSKTHLSSTAARLPTGTKSITRSRLYLHLTGSSRTQLHLVCWLSELCSLQLAYSCCTVSASILYES